MNMIISFSIEVIITVVVCALLVIYLRQYLYRILLDLCGSDDRAQFWTVFSTILLVGIPMIFALGYRPEALTSLDMFFEIIGRLRGNLYAYLASLLIIGMIVSFFALVAPKPGKAESK
jgi:hypothetical protein